MKEEMNIKYSKKIVAALIVLFAFLAMCTPIQGAVTFPPVADAGDDQTAFVGATVSFDGSGSYDTNPSGTIVSYDWDFGDGTTTVTGMITTHVYAAAGTYTVTLTVTSDSGAVAPDTASVIVTAPNQAPDVSGIPGETVNAGVSFATINLDDYVQDDNDVSEITWTGTTSGPSGITVAIDADRVATITYPDGWTGSEIITFTATDPGELSDSDDATFTVVGLENIVDIDIKPESCPNPVNLDKQGLLPVAIIGTGDFDITDIDPDTILLTREGCDSGVAPIRWNYEDVATPYTGTDDCGCHELGGDGYLDMSLKFDTQELVIELNLVEVVGQTIPLTLTGKLRDGTLFEGQDCIWVLETEK